MATTGTSMKDREPADLASHLRGADLVRVVGGGGGGRPAPRAPLAPPLAYHRTPSPLSLSPAGEAAPPRPEAAGTAVALGFEDVDQSCLGDSAALCAFETAQELGTEPDPGLALAGATCAGVPPQDPALEAAQDRGLTERPGLAIPTADVTEGLAYTGLLHADFSGDEDATRAFLSELDLPEPLDAAAHRQLASAVALEATDTPTGERAPMAIADAFGPLTSPTAFETIGGYADVLDAAATTDPAAALTALLGDRDEAALLDLWREYGTALHDAVAALPTGDGAVETATVDVQPDDVARLGYDFRVDADRLYVGGPASIALATHEQDARRTLESHFPNEQITGIDTLATVQTDDLDSVVTDIEAAQ